MSLWWHVTTWHVTVVTCHQLFINTVMYGQSSERGRDENKMSEQLETLRQIDEDWELLSEQKKRRFYIFPQLTQRQHRLLRDALQASKLNELCCYVIWEAGNYLPGTKYGLPLVARVRWFPDGWDETRLTCQGFTVDLWNTDGAAGAEGVSEYTRYEHSTEGLCKFMDLRPELDSIILE